MIRLPMRQPAELLAAGLEVALAQQQSSSILETFNVPAQCITNLKPRD